MKFQVLLDESGIKLRCWIVAGITNEGVLDRVNNKGAWEKTIWRRKKNWIEHIWQGDNMLRDIVEGKIDGK